MLDTPAAVFEALRENHDRPHSLQRTVTAEELVEAAAAFEKPDVLVTALFELMTAYEFTGENSKSPVAFARLLKLWDTAPETFSEWEVRQVFWRFKWVMASLLQVPEVPLGSIGGWIDQMQARYEAADHGLQPVAAMHYHVAYHTGTDVDGAYALWTSRPRTELSDCEACEIRHRARHQVTTGDDAGAIDTWQPVLDGVLTCSEEPQMSQARALLPLLRAGNLDAARSHHLTGYRRVRGTTGVQEEAGEHLEFCALSRNEGRGLEILAENRSLFDASGTPLAALPRRPFRRISSLWCARHDAWRARVTPRAPGSGRGSPNVWRTAPPRTRTSWAWTNVCARSSPSTARICSCRTTSTGRLSPS
ncbi:hypothetical protein [Streptomyces sp. Ac-502]|uniref:hypothetical protein n=1 Tax=Streptomyces sp. Ac-502 TaxID=3342801 RepID=UPI0038621F88